MKKFWIALVIFLFVGPVLSKESMNLNFKALKSTSHNIVQARVTNSANHLDYTVSIALPPSYTSTSDKKYPILYLLDSHLTFHLAEGISKWLFRETGERRVEEFILVGIDYRYPKEWSWSDIDKHWFKSRYHELTPYETLSERHGQIKGQGEAFYQFLNQSVIQPIEAQFPIQKNKRAFAGYSLAGLFTAHIFVEHPESFDIFMIGDPSLWYGSSDTGLDDGCETGLVDDNRCLLANGSIFQAMDKLSTPTALVDKNVFITTNELSPDVMAFTTDQFIERAKTVFPNLSFAHKHYKGESHSSGVIAFLTDGIRHVFANHQ